MPPYAHNSSALVVGGGVMGMATACALAARGVQVTVLERFTLAHPWASSHGLSRAIRHEYGAQALYTEMVMSSLKLWKALASETGRQLYTEAGVLTLGHADDDYTLPGYTVMHDAGLPIVQLTRQQCERTFPQFRVAEYDAITYNASGGMLHASECVYALAQRFKAQGGTLREHIQVARIEPSATQAYVILKDGTKLTADRVVVTAGPWIHDVLPELPLPVRAVRGQVCYVAELRPEFFAAGTFPVFLAGAEAYGFPLQGPDGWFKIGSDGHDIAADPNTPYAYDTTDVADLQRFMQRVIPSASRGRLASVDCCMYDMTPDLDFILDRYPGSESIIIGSGFSGHGFKFGILVGELLAALALDEAPQFPLDAFRLSRFTPVKES